MDSVKPDRVVSVSIRIGEGKRTALTSALRRRGISLQSALERAIDALIDEDRTRPALDPANATGTSMVRAADGRSVRIGETMRRLMILVAAGKSNRSMAAETGLEYTSVRTTVWRLSKIAGVRNREELIAWCTQVLDVDSAVHPSEDSP